MLNWNEHIVLDKNVLWGKPTIKGTRLSVEFILQLLSQGWTVEKILENYPRLTTMDIQAVHAYECLHDNVVTVLERVQ